MRCRILQCAPRQTCLAGCHVTQQGITAQQRDAALALRGAASVSRAAADVRPARFCRADRGAAGRAPFRAQFAESARQMSSAGVSIVERASVAPWERFHPSVASPSRVNKKSVRVRAVYGNGPCLEGQPVSLTSVFVSVHGLWGQAPSRMFLLDSRIPL